MHHRVQHYLILVHVCLPLAINITIACSHAHPPCAGFVVTIQYYEYFSTAVLLYFITETLLMLYIPGVDYQV